MTIQTAQGNARTRLGKLGPRALSKRGLISRAMALGWPAEQIDKLYAEFGVIWALEQVEAAESELADAVKNDADVIDFDAIVSDWPELSAPVKDRLRVLLKAGK